MSLLNTLAWWQWWLLAAIPLGIVLLYFLKLRRQPLEVPSTYLWSRTIEDLHVNSLWQRLRQNLLLFLQLLVVLFLILALLRPGWRGEELIGDRFIFLIDNSASMNATDGAPSRLAVAKQKATELVAQMKPGDVATVIAFSDSARIVQTFTDSRRALRNEIARIQPTYRSTDLREALRAAGGLTNPGVARSKNNFMAEEALPATLYILSDGRLGTVADFSLGHLLPQYIAIGTESAANRGIVAFAVQRNPEQPDQLQAFANVANTGPEAATIQLELLLDGASVDLVELDIPGNDTAGWNFNLPDLDEAQLKLVMTPQDALETDNTAFAVVNRPRLANVLLVTQGNPPLETAMATEQSRQIATISVAEPDLLTEEQFQTDAATGVFDLIVFDRCSPAEMPQANTLFIDALPPGDSWQAEEIEAAPYIIDMDRIHPLTQLVDMSNVKTATGFSLKPPPGNTVLFESANGPLFAIAPRFGFEDAVLGFSLLKSEDGEIVPNTTWPLRSSFPVFVLNVLRYLGGQQSFLNTANVAPGTPVTLRALADSDQISVTGPRGNRQQPVRAGNRSLVATQTEVPGIYEVHEPALDEVTSRFAVNLFNQEESNLIPAASLELGSSEVSRVEQVRATRRELWKWALLLCLLLVLFEWYVYNRRVYL